MPESFSRLASDSRWPGFFPSSVSYVTVTDGHHSALEKVVGATIVNRFPYVIALSFCSKSLSSRHYARSRFIEMIEAGRSVAIHYLAPGAELDGAMHSILSHPDQQATERIAASGLQTRPAETNPCPVLAAAYLVYEARLVRPQPDFEGGTIFEKPWLEVGSHRVYFFEIEAIQLKTSIATGRNQIFWKSLPDWKPVRSLQSFDGASRRPVIEEKYQKPYSSHYVFPSAETVSFSYDEIKGDMAVKYLPPLARDQVEVDNDRARWPCFFPSSLGMISTTDAAGSVNVMPCGSTAVFIRDPFAIGICVSYAKINVRYAPRHSLQALQSSQRFVCGVPFSDPTIISAIRYSGNISGAQDRSKIHNSGLQHVVDSHGPILPALPVSFRCRIVETLRMGTHYLFLGQVESILQRDDVTSMNPIRWCPHATVIPASQ